MQAGKDLIGKQIISISDGRQLGTVKDLYLDSSLNLVVGVYLGAQGLFSRKSLLIERNNVMVFGVDAILAKHADAVTDSSKAVEWAKWIRRDKLQGWQVATAGGTKVGTIDDVILDEAMRVIGFRLLRVFVEGPIAERRAVAREAVIEAGNEDEVMIIDLSKAERQSLGSK
ncbi:MAG: PRC-barrel domain-containing protein [Anaerolineales bacterium]|nr:PRC-barrel domain-containing protein [Anaerolineales bacterium]